MPERRVARERDEVLRVVLADDHAVVREGLKAIVNAQTDMSVVGEAADGQQAVGVARALRPDVIVMDLSMPTLSGVEATQALHAECPDVKILGLTVHAERTYLTQLLGAGASGYVLKRSAPLDLVAAIRAVAAGGTYIDPGIAGTVVEGFLDSRAGADRDDATLSVRERDVLLRVARGFSNKEIAAELGISVKTVETYKARVSEKLGLQSRVDIVRYAARRGWLDVTV
jgi:DNA-binding NarL/FixJ family response regulator